MPNRTRKGRVRARVLLALAVIVATLFSVGSASAHHCTVIEAHVWILNACV